MLVAEPNHSEDAGGMVGCQRFRRMIVLDVNTFLFLFTLALVLLCHLCNCLALAPVQSADDYDTAASKPKSGMTSLLSTVQVWMLRLALVTASAHSSSAVDRRLGLLDRTSSRCVASSLRKLALARLSHAGLISQKICKDMLLLMCSRATTSATSPTRIATLCYPLCSCLPSHRVAAAAC